MRTASLQAVIRRGMVSTTPSPVAEPVEPCALCATDLGADHPHMLDMEIGRPLCVCRACGLLFDRPAASGGRYRRIPDRRLPLVGVDPQKLRIPVGLAFFVLGDDGAVSAHYPSPAGATRWDVDQADWKAVGEECPGLKEMLPEVEALLVNTTQGRTEAWVVPLSDCYSLVGVVRQSWEGLTGGPRVWNRMDDFFEQLRRNDGHDTSG